MVPTFIAGYGLMRFFRTPSGIINISISGAFRPDVSSLMVYLSDLKILTSSVRTKAADSPI